MHAIKIFSAFIKKRYGITACIGLCAMGLVTGLNSCKKQTTVVLPADSADVTRLGILIKDNFNYNLYNQIITRTGYSDTLLQPGPFTVVLPADKAFLNDPGLGFYKGLFALKDVASYHIFRGAASFKSMPLKYGQELTTLTGSKLYINKFVYNADTIITVNGATVLLPDIKASNGLIETISRQLNPLVYKNMLDYVQSNPSLTFLNAAIQRANLSPLLKGAGSYTLLAPSDQAFMDYGANTGSDTFSSIDKIYQADPAVLAGLLRYHLLQSRKFLGDFVYLSKDQSDFKVKTLNGKNITLQYNTTDQEGKPKVTFLGNQNSYAASIYFQSLSPYYNLGDIPTGNGNVHVIDQVLIP